MQEASEMECLTHTLSHEGPYIYKLSEILQQNLARLEEDQVESVAGYWKVCEEIEELGLEVGDLHDFMFQLVHFCQIASNDDLGVYIYSDD